MFGYAEQEVVGTDPFKLIQSSERGGVENAAEPKCLTIYDRGQLESALFNLVANARDALADGKGEIAMTTAVVSRVDEKTAESRAIARDRAVLHDQRYRRRHRFGPKPVARSVAQAQGAICIERSEGVGATIRLFLPLRRK